MTSSIASLEDGPPTPGAAPPVCEYRTDWREHTNRIVRCRRSGCPQSVPEKRFCCPECWRQLSARTRGALMRLGSYLATHPGDEAALRVRAVAIAVAEREWG